MKMNLKTIINLHTSKLLLKFTGILVFALFTNSCNQPVNQDNQNVTGAFEALSNNDGPEKFVGAWKYYATEPNDKPNDRSMDHIICKLEKLEGTEETFVFHLWTGNDLILSVKDKNTLVGQNASLNVVFEESTGHLKLFGPNSSSINIFSKLK